MTGWAEYAVSDSVSLRRCVYGQHRFRQLLSSNYGTRHNTFLAGIGRKPQHGADFEAMRICKPVLVQSVDFFPARRFTQIPAGDRAEIITRRDPILRLARTIDDEPRRAGFSVGRRAVCAAPVTNPAAKLSTVQKIGGIEFLPVRRFGCSSLFHSPQ